MSIHISCICRGGESSYPGCQNPQGLYIYISKLCSFHTARYNFVFFFQAARNGMVQHLEHLLFYGADMNARNASGNTSLHVCAVNDQESCARVLLFRGCDKEAMNFANQTPYQVAVIADNLHLADIIHGHGPDHIGTHI